MYLPSKNQKSKVAIPARTIRTIRNIAYYNSPRLKKIFKLLQRQFPTVPLPISRKIH